MSNENAILQAIANFDKTDPAQKRAWDLLVKDFYKLYYTIYPPTTVSRSVSTSTSTLGEIQNYTATAFGTNLRLQHDVLSGAFRYETRLGSNWNTAVPIISTNSNVVNLDPTAAPHKLIYGTYTFLVRPLDSNGLYGEHITSVTFTVPSIGAPVLTGTVISNNAILDWDNPTSTWKIDYYNVYKGGSFVARVSASFKIQPEIAAGTYTYSVEAVDIVGNVSPISNDVSLAVAAPLDYFQVGVVQADYAGTYSNTKKIIRYGITGIIGAVYSESWKEHFVNNSWTSIQDQIDAGYDLYFQPGNTTDGTYEEIFDFGSILTDINITARFSTTQLNGTSTISTEISYSDDNVTYSTPVSGTALFASSARYAKVTLTFHNNSDKAAIFLSSLRITADVLLQTDSGNADVLAADSGGTEVTYNLSYSQINSITLTPNSLIPVTPIYTNVTITSFKILAFDNAGHRVDANISWKVRGVLL